MLERPKGILVDYGGTLVEEAGFDAREGNRLLLSRAAYVSPGVTLDVVLDRANRVSAEVSERRDQVGIETPWPSLTGLIHDYLGTRFDVPMAELELAFWNAAVSTRPMPGVHDALGFLSASRVSL